MKVLFIKTSIGTSDYSSFDMGIGSITSVLTSHKHTVDFFSLENWSSMDILIQRVTNFKPKIVGLSAVASTFKPCVKIASILKKKFPSIYFILGGVHITLFPEDFTTAKSIDAICLGEGEYALLGFIKRYQKGDQTHRYTRGFWTRKNGKIKKNPPSDVIQDLNKLPPPNRELFSKEGVLWVGSRKKLGLEFIFSRGCPFKCTYCSNHALSKFYGSQYVRILSPRRALAEIKQVMRSYRYDYFRFHDDTFTLNKKWLESFLNMYRKEIRVPFSCNIRVGTCTKKTLQKLKQAGCEEVTIGIESGDFELRKKVLNRINTNRQIVKTFRWAKEVNLKTFAFIMIGFPRESPESFLKTVRLVAKINPDSHILYIFHPYPGTKLYEICKKEGLFLKRMPSDFIERKDTILNLPTFQRKDILYYFENFDMLINLCKRESNLLKRLHRKLLFYNYSKPPSYSTFCLHQGFLQVYRSAVSLSKTFYHCMRPK
jgi:radical SAM superfamily enzyme YgiQ (UPF0313 family)